MSKSQQYSNTPNNFPHLLQRENAERHSIKVLARGADYSHHFLTARGDFTEA